jgi:RNA polymerase sigma-70 factor, ECF subfamily
MTETAHDIENLTAPYQALRQGMLGFLRKQVSDPMAAEDLLQEVFLKALAAGKKGAAPKHLTGWLYTIARNTVIDYYRAKKPSESFTEDSLDTALTAESPNHVEVQGLAHCLKPLAEQLPPAYRHAVVATEFEGKTLQALANESKVSLSAMKSRASRGRVLLKEKLLACCQIEVSKTGSVIGFEGRCNPPSCDTGNVLKICGGGA